MTTKNLVTIKTHCPNCSGDGLLEIIARLTYDGDQSLRMETCQHCAGSGYSDEPAICPLCGDEIIQGEQDANEETPVHAECLAHELSEREKSPGDWMQGYELDDPWPGWKGYAG